MSETAKAPLPRHVRGKRPQFFDDPASDHLLAMVLELSGELWTVKSRQNALESYLRTISDFDAETFEKHTLNPPEQSALEAWQGEFMKRLFRTIEAEAN